MREKIASLDLKRRIKEYALITVALLIYAFSWVGVILPAEVMGGGVNGMGMLIYYATGGANGGIPLGVSFFVINAIFVVAGALLIGLSVGAKTLYAIVMLSFIMGFMQEFLPPDLLGIADEKFLSVILGGMLAGLGVSLCFMQGGNSGGTDIIALIINKYRTISYGRILMSIDLITITCSIFVLHDIKAAIYGMVMVAACGYTIDAVLAGNRQSTQILIVSRKYDEIASRIYDSMGRGVTLIDGQGWYSKEPIKLVMVVCRKSESSIMFHIIKEVDPNAFMTFGSVMGVYGLGFEALKK